MNWMDYTQYVRFENNLNEKKLLQHINICIIYKTTLMFSALGKGPKKSIKSVVFDQTGEGGVDWNQTLIV